MSIQYIQDNVTFSAPDGNHTDYQATINVVFSVNTDGTFSAEYLYTQTVTGGTSMEDLYARYTTARQGVTDDTLVEYAAGTPTTYSPPSPRTVGPVT